MAKKLSSGVMIALIAILSLFGSVGTSFAAQTVAGPSYSKWIYAEMDETLNFETVVWSYISREFLWSSIDTLVTSSMTYDTTYDYWHVFVRRSRYKDALKVDSYDTHLIYRVLKEYNAEPMRIDGRVKWKKPDGTYVAHQHLQINADTVLHLKWSSIPYDGGFPLYQDENISDITIFERMALNKPFDPLNPPGYAVIGMNDPNNITPDPNAPNPSNPDDPDFPKQPTPPDNNWDLIGWLKYLVEWLIYIVKCFVYFLKSFGSAIGDVVTGSASLISAMSDFFAFLPNQVTTIIGMGILAMIIVGIVKR